MDHDLLVIITARDEGDRVQATLRALTKTFPQAHLCLVDDGSRDETSARARAAGAEVVRSERTLGKGAAATLGARRMLERRALAGETVERRAPERPTLADGAMVLLCDADLAESAGRLVPLVQAVSEGRGDIAVACFASRVGGGFGIVVRYARRAIERSCGVCLRAPLSGQRAMRAATLRELLPFADGFGMEAGMAIDATRLDKRIVEVELDLHHRATGRTLGGFLHRGHQLLDIARAVRGR